MRLIPQKRDFLFSSFSQLDKKWRAIFDRRIAKLGLSYVQYQMLEILTGRFNYPPAFKETAAVMETSHQNVKQIALILAAKGFVEMKPDTKDGRVIRIHITKSAEELVENFRQKKKDLIRSFFDELDDPEIETLFDLLLKLEGKADRFLN